MGVFHLSWGQGVRTASPPAPPRSLNSFETHPFDLVTRQL